MGWWSATVMGGDTPSDYIGDMEDRIGLERYNAMNDDEKSFTPEEVKTAIRTKMSLLMKYCEEADDCIAYQVLGVMIISNGVKMEDDIKATIIEACQEDEWYQEGDKERVFFMDAFIKQLNDYDGTPVEIAHEGLFEAFGKVLGGGLINKNI